MDGNNFFISLSKYRPEIGRDPREDFLTEAFAYLLRLDKELLSQIAEYLLRNSGIVGARVIREISISINKDESVLVETQKSHESGRPDLEISGDNFLIAVECKYGSGLGSSQLQRYLKDLQGGDKEYKYLLLLSEENRSVDARTLRNSCFLRNSKSDRDCFLWSEICRIILNRSKMLNAKSDANIKKVVIRDFLDYLEEEGMSYRELKATDYNEWERTRVFLKGLRKTFESICSNLQDLYIKRKLFRKYSNRFLTNLEQNPISTKYDGDKKDDTGIYQKFIFRHYRKDRLGFIVQLYLYHGDITIWMGVAWSKSVNDRLAGRSRFEKIKRYLKKKWGRNGEIWDSENYGSSYSRGIRLKDLLKGKRNKNIEEALISYCRDTMREIEKTGIIDLIIRRR
ncbi:hypothetical protein COY52_06185 [Candidatus Desantisbacteria bacterium CG_4_10_14_0_8_um_filter_48_22]|uniref:PD-(D/E)XK nuclease superfamily protein n=1 Tax=Candidatus Desantisbacteria bacterium CG_4_10_14_0_8_um_filter_48_22 TaxID=1974543 RepID=A0A2M7SBB6_9BACT|nr:MAG: hypothetical protein COY52_06185 [Candidatus Desantisbacteria bacterium CG_4_10_14_0_8_um_filter_48_22]